MDDKFKKNPFYRVFFDKKFNNKFIKTPSYSSEWNEIIARVPLKNYAQLLEPEKDLLRNLSNKKINELIRDNEIISGKPKNRLVIPERYTYWIPKFPQNIMQNLKQLKFRNSNLDMVIYEPNIIDNTFLIIKFISSKLINLYNIYMSAPDIVSYYILKKLYNEDEEFIFGYYYVLDIYKPYMKLLDTGGIIYKDLIEFPYNRKDSSYIEMIIEVDTDGINPNMFFAKEIKELGSYRSLDQTSNINKRLCKIGNEIKFHQDLQECPRPPVESQPGINAQPKPYRQLEPQPGINAQPELYRQIEPGINAQPISYRQMEPQPGINTYPVSYRRIEPTLAPVSS